MDVPVIEGDVKGETSDVEVVMGARGVVGEGIEAGVEKSVPGEGVENGETIDSDGETWTGEVVGASAVAVSAAVGGPFLFPAGPGGPFLLPWRPGASVFTGSRGIRPF